MLASVSRDGRGRIPHHHVGVAAHCDRALLRIQPEDARRCGAGHLDEPLRRERRLSLQRGCEPEWQPRADAGQAGRHLREVAGHRQLVAVEPEMAVIGGVGIESAVAQAAHQGGAVAGGAQRRCHHVAQRVRPLVLGALEAQVVWADLAIDGHPAPPRRGDLGERASARHVHHVGRRARDLGQRQEAVDALGLERDRPAARKRGEPEPALGDELPREQVDRTAVLAVREHDHAQRRGLLHHGERDVVVGHDAELDVGEPELDAPDPHLRDVAQIARAIGERLPDHRVEGEVDERSGSSSASVRRAASTGRSPASASTKASALVVPPSSAERVSARTRSEDVRVHVDRSRQHEAARRVDHLGAASARSRPRARSGRPRSARRPRPGRRTDHLASHDRDARAALTMRRRRPRGWERR